jgi:predicted Rossmann fold nucleotide-binding protein DprA/Smf involved in DNA uptake|tara:strand:+ start:990 stop:1394 length:405 start_codon:yes stop_codon:yes gene_type:complete
MKKIAIVGSRVYDNKVAIKDFIFKIKNNFGLDTEIVSGGQKDGADGFAKKYALEFGLKYVEFPPSHYNWNMHCKLPATKYNKPYYVSNYFKRNKQIAEYADYIVAFIHKNSKTKGAMHTIKEAQKLNKKYIIIN